MILLLSSGLGSVGFSSDAATPFQAEPIAQAQSNEYNCLTLEVWSPEKQAWCDQMQSESPRVQGTVTYLQRSALPPDAIVEVTLRDVSRQDVAAEVLATQTIELDGQQVPVPFQLSYDATQIDPSHTYALQARIFVEGQLRFINTAAYWVITRDHPTEVEIVVQPVN